MSVASRASKLLSKAVSKSDEDLTPKEKFAAEAKERLKDKQPVPEKKKSRAPFVSTDQQILKDLRNGKYEEELSAKEKFAEKAKERLKKKEDSDKEFAKGGMATKSRSNPLNKFYGK